MFFQKRVQKTLEIRIIKVLIKNTDFWVPSQTRQIRIFVNRPGNLHISSCPSDSLGEWWRWKWLLSQRYLFVNREQPKSWTSLKPALLLLLLLLGSKTFGTRKFLPCPANLIIKTAASLPTIHKLNSEDQISRKKCILYWQSVIYHVGQLFWR